VVKKYTRKQLRKPDEFISISQGYFVGDSEEKRYKKSMTIHEDVLDFVAENIKLV